MSTVLAVAVISVQASFPLSTSGQTPRLNLEKQLLEEDLVALAEDARKQGDAKRGAVVFHQPANTCTKCHLQGKNASPLGPDMTKMGKETTDQYIVESILAPSKEIKKGKPKIVSFFAKKARGAMARYIVQNRLHNPANIHIFDHDGYCHNPSLSTPNTPVFTR